MWNLNALPHEFQPDVVEDYPPVTHESIERAKAATRAERERNGLDPDTGKLPVPVSEKEHQEQLERLADMQTVFSIARKYGGARVQNWIRNYERGS